MIEAHLPGDGSLRVGIEHFPVAEQRRDEIGIRRVDARLGEGHADAVGEIVGIECAAVADVVADAGDLGVEAQPFCLAEQIAVHPIGLDTRAIQRRIAAANAEAPRQSFLDDDADRQLPVGADGRPLFDPLRAEHVEPRQPGVRPLYVVGIEFLADRQIGHIGDERRIHPVGALNRGRAVDGPLARLDHQRRIERIAVVGCLDAPLDDLSLGMALLPPRLDRKAFGLAGRRRSAPVPRSRNPFSPAGRPRRRYRQAAAPD